MSSFETCNMQADGVYTKKNWNQRFNLCSGLVFPTMFGPARMEIKHSYWKNSICFAANTVMVSN